MTYVWLGVIALFTLVELSVMGFQAVWFALGGLAALIAGLAGASVWVQPAVFLFVSALLTVTAGPAARRRLLGSASSDGDAFIGREGEVIDELCDGNGRVRIGAQLWSADSEDGEIIRKGERITVLRVEGIKAIVGRRAEK